MTNNITVGSVDFIPKNLLGEMTDKRPHLRFVFAAEWSLDMAIQLRAMPRQLEAHGLQLAQNGTTIIFSTHRMEQVEEICNHIVLVNKGKKILDGTVQGVRQDFKENLFGIQLEKIPETMSSPAFEIIGTDKPELTVKINEGFKPNDVLGYFMNQGSSIISFKEILPSLNDIFIKLVEGTPTARQFEKITA